MENKQLESKAAVLDKDIRVVASQLEHISLHKNLTKQTLDIASQVDWDNEQGTESLTKDLSKINNMLVKLQEQINVLTKEKEEATHKQQI